ncbi:hypothetical protein [Nocardia yamanashiensis]|uniref:hypothetical protein n=1 Tax=Nocardia yamanashiensis TaxID=209247 RepID=UPI0008370AB5|nr:hypothetical protein [Nocardia yamanashiensis]
MTRQSATELADAVAEMVHQVRRRAGEEIRADIGREIGDRFVGRPGMDRSAYSWQHPDDCVLEELTNNPALQKLPMLQAALKRFDDEDGDGITEDFRAGIAFAVALLTDPDFNY